MTNTHDIIIIGGGPGGYVAAIRASQLGMKVALVEREHLGGVCLNWGCIPTKALLKSAETYRAVKEAEAFGVQVGEVSFDIKKMVKRSREVSAQLTGGIGHLMKKHQVEVITGHGSLSGKGAVRVMESAEKNAKKVADVQAPHIILATGARARVLPGLEPDGKHIVTYRDALVPESAPKSLLVIGSGAIGMEFASFYTQLGVPTTVVEVADRILPAEDEEISAQAHQAFEAQGMKIHTKAGVKALKSSKQGVKATLEVEGKAKEQSFDRVIVAVGIVPNIEGLGLEGTGVATERGHVAVDPWLETGEPGIYAIGDLVAGPWLAHKASHEGIICVEAIAKKQGNKLVDPHPLKTSHIPGCTYTYPQIASVGLSEAAAKAAGYNKVKVGRFPFLGNGKALASGKSEGMIKTLFDANTGALLGAHMVGAEVTELIHSFALALSSELTEAELMHTVFPHPTLSEMLHESVLEAYDRALHI